MTEHYSMVVNAEMSLLGFCTCAMMTMMMMMMMLMLLLLMMMICSESMRVKNHSCML